MDKIMMNEDVQDVEEMIFEIELWKELQLKHCTDIEFYHYAESKINYINVMLDAVYRTDG